MVYARVHNQTVAEDYYTAMELVEERLSLVAVEGDTDEARQPGQREQLLKLVNELAQPDLDSGARRRLAAQVRNLPESGTETCPTPATGFRLSEKSARRGEGFVPLLHRDSQLRTTK